MHIDKFFDLIKVYDTPYTKVRLGRNNDGGYVVPHELLTVSRIEGMYSIGIGNDFSFEEDLEARYNVPHLYLVDDCIREEFYATGKSFIQKRLGKDMSIQQLRRQHPIQGNKMLKFDIEGDEWDAIGYHSDYDIIVCELHLFTVEPKQYYTDYFKGLQKNFASKVNETLFEKYYSFLSALLNNYAIFHVHGNNSIPKTEMCGYSFPPLLEMTLINKKFMNDSWRISTETFPTAIDQPNKTDRPDFSCILPFKNEQV